MKQGHSYLMFMSSGMVADMDHQQFLSRDMKMRNLVYAKRLKYEIITTQKGKCKKLRKHKIR
jgi:hypothetical protein